MEGPRPEVARKKDAATRSGGAGAWHRIPSFNEMCATVMDDADTLLVRAPPARQGSAASSVPSPGRGGSPAGTPRAESVFAATFARALEEHMRFD